LGTLGFASHPSRDKNMPEKTLSESEAAVLKDPWLQAIWQQLGLLGHRHQVCFGLLCAETLLPAYYRTGKYLRREDEIDVVKSAVSQLWEYVVGDRRPEEIGEVLGAVREVETGEEDCCADWAGAIDALSSLEAVLESFTTGALGSAKAALAVVTYLDRMVLNDLLGHESGPHRADEMAAIDRLVEESELMLNIKQSLVELVNGLKLVPDLSSQDVAKFRDAYSQKLA
jgi:hypothetical protein